MQRPPQYVSRLSFTQPRSSMQRPTLCQQGLANSLHHFRCPHNLHKGLKLPNHHPTTMYRPLHKCRVLYSLHRGQCNMLQEEENKQPLYPNQQKCRKWLKVQGSVFRRSVVHPPGQP
ncbi:hypothetical protein Salat_0674000 [Sesamum alatum]|uniref:Uncharacterized protein n=1 Tax=Sesamum alatum TaxID=300844 RepID=A0AAE2CUL0_9LAMI|nr:hypothetical protein Salat_0674000 [Sesamum alatum]